MQESSTSFDRDLFEPFIGANVWAVRLGFAAMSCVLAGAFLLTRSSGVIILLTFATLSWAGFEMAIGIYRHCRVEIRTRGTLVLATIIHKAVMPHGTLRKITVTFGRDGVPQKASFYVSTATYYGVEVGQAVEIRSLQAGLCRLIPPVPIRCIPAAVNSG